MADFDLVLRGGTCVTAADMFVCDVGIRNGKIAALGDRLGPGAQEISAVGKWLLPGGIDSHCHIDQPLTDGAVMADDFSSGSHAAACGGTTTIIPFACQFKGQSLQAAIDDYHARASGKSIVDYAFHVIVSDPSADVLTNELPRLVENGYTSFKIYMTYDDMKLSDYQILEMLSFARQSGATIMLHAENTDCITWLTNRLLQAGNVAPRFHADSRPGFVEREATHRAITFSELLDVPILLVHISGQEAVEQIRWAQGKGLKIYAETCPQYLFLTRDCLDLPGNYGMKCICSPPPREKKDQVAIWNGLMNDTFQVFSSDHAPFRFEDPKGKKLHGENAPFNLVPNGIPGIETRLPLLFSEGVLRGKITPQQFVALTSSNAARLYGIYPQKGTIAVGADGDIVVWDVNAKTTITNSALHHNADYTPYEGMELLGRVETTIIRGSVVQHMGEISQPDGFGQFLRAAKPNFR